MLPQTREHHRRIQIMERTPRSHWTDEDQITWLIQQNDQLQERNRYLESWAERANDELERHGLLMEQRAAVTDTALSSAPPSAATSRPTPPSHTPPSVPLTDEQKRKVLGE